MLSQVKVFNSLDNTLAINVFAYKSGAGRARATPGDAPELMRYAEALQAGGPAAGNSSFALSCASSYFPCFIRQRNTSFSASCMYDD
jgi:hypothetical protein